MECDHRAGGKVAAVICLVLVVALAVMLLLWKRPDRKVKFLVRLSQRLRSLQAQISFRAKCITAQLSNLWKAR